MARQKTVIVDLGTAYVSIYEGGSVLLRQPNVGLFDTTKSKLSLIACGYDVLRDVQVEGYERISPVVDGVLINREAEVLILKQFFKDLKTRSILDPTRVYVTVSAGLTAIEKGEIESVFSKIGYKDVELVVSVTSILDAVGYEPSLVAILGAGSLEVGVVSRDGIISACSLNIGGNTVNQKLVDKIFSQYNIKISNTTAEKLKIQIGSLTENDYTTAQCSGRDIIDGRIKNCEITAEALRPTIVATYTQMADTIMSLLTTIPNRLFDVVKKRGLYLAGGGALMRGAEDFFQQATGLMVKVLDVPQLAVVRGLGKVLDKGIYQI